MDRVAFQRWLDDYVEAWKTYDKAIGALFNDHAIYRYHPWDDAGEAVAGRDAIVADWLEDRDEPGSWTAEHEAWAVDGERAVGIGSSR